jgi:hypothetical protein
MARFIIRTWWWWATLVRAGSHDILPLDAEEVRNEDGREKQDCALNAGKRLAERLREKHRQLKLCICGDALYAHEPFVLKLRELRMGFVLVAKPGSHQELFDWSERQFCRGLGAKQRTQVGLPQ